jgi:hypothetical protein
MDKTTNAPAIDIDAIALAVERIKAMVGLLENASTGDYDLQRVQVGVLCDVVTTDLGKDQRSNRAGAAGYPEARGLI